jgi:hypothetical protein
MGFSGRLNTAFIERVNLTIRQGIAALARLTWATAKPAPHLFAHLEWWRAYYHGCRALITHCEWRLCSRETEGQAGGTMLPTTDSGDGSRQNHPMLDRARFSLAHCLQLRLERLASLTWEECRVAERWVKVPAEALE